MSYKIVADSCCDLLPQIRKEWGVRCVPLTMTLGEKVFSDDDSLDLHKFMEEVKKCNDRIGSSCPSPLMYKEAFLEAKTSFAVTLSSKLSGSYQSAMLGKSLAEKEGANVHVFDSKSASAGEALVVLKVREMIREGFGKQKIIKTIEKLISNMKTYFALENIETLRKNGRLSKITGKLISVLNIKPIMGSDGNGSISLFSHARSQKQIIRKLSDTIENCGKKTEGESLVITHCDNLELAKKLKVDICERYSFKQILVLPTRGLSSVYANEKGIVIAY